MPNFQRKGIYSGGVVTKGSGSDTHLYISPYMLNLYDGDVTGVGTSQVPGVAKEILIVFGGVPGGVTEREDTLSPGYTISTGSSTGNVWIYYDESKQDIAFSNTPLAGVITFAKITWDMTFTMAGVQIISDYVAPPTGPNRTEAYLAEIDNPADAKNFYYDGQKFIGGKLNKPLANMAVVMEALQEQSLSLLGGTFFITLTTLSDIVGSGVDITLAPVRHISRTNTTYKIYNTKENSGLYGAGNAFKRTFGAAGDVNGDNLVITIKRDTGVPGIFLASETGLYNTTTTDYAIARTTGPWDGNSLLTGVSNLNQLTWEIQNNLISLNEIKSSIARLTSGAWPSGFFNTFSLTTAGTNNTVNIPELIGSVKGNNFYMGASTITLDAPPATGARQDFIFVQVNIQTAPEIVITPTLRFFTDFDYASNNDPFDNTDILAQRVEDAPGVPAGTAFTLQPDGSYRAADYESVEYYALPLAIVPRFNTGAYADANLNGGGSRPDGKTALILSDAEILTTAPLINRKDKKQLFDASFKQVLEGRLGSLLGLAVSSPDSYSKQPLQVDYLLSYSVGTEIGDTDGGRRFWSGNTSKAIPMGLTFAHDTNTTWPYLDFTYNIGGDSTITLRVPNSIASEAEIYSELNGQPRGVTVQWVDDGTPVALIGLWVLTYTTTPEDSLVTTATIDLDTTDANYIAHHATGGTKIAVSFKVRYSEPKPLTRVPIDFYKVQRDNNNGKANYFAVTPDTANNPAFFKTLNAAGSRVIAPIDAVTYYDKLYVNRAGATTKGYAHLLYFVMPGNGQTTVDYVLPTSYEILASDYPLFGDNSIDYKVLGVIDALDKNGNSIGITKLEWKVTVPSFNVLLGQLVLETDPIYFVLGLDGQQFDYSPGSLEISNLTKAVSVVGPLTAPNAEHFHYAYFDTDTNIGGQPIYGFSSLQNKLKIYAESDAVGTELLAVPVKITGVQGALLKISTVITTAEFNAMSSIYQDCYETNPGPQGGKRLKEGNAIRFSILYGMDETEALVMTYNFGASPFIPFDPDSIATVVYSGVVLLSTDGTANESSSIYSPVSERFPVVQGVEVVGIDTVPTPLGLNPVELYGQDGEWLTEGSVIKLDGSMSLGIFVNEGTGLAVWGCLVQIGVRLLLFIYEVRDGQMVLTSPDQAFIAELQHYTRELQ